MRLRYTRLNVLGPVLWVFCLQYFVVQVVVAAAWTTSFSLTSHPISDLGNTSCGLYAGRWVCSPWHGLMNGSFLVLGFCMAVGAWLVQRHLGGHGRMRSLGFACLIVAGFSTYLVGLFPEDTIALGHALGVGLALSLGNIGLILLGRSLDLPRGWRWHTVGLGSIGLVGLGLFVWHAYLGLGQGGMERVAAYPQTIWLITFGLFLLLRKDFI